MMKLNETKAGMFGQFVAVGGLPEFQRRITAVGITPGGTFSIIQNEKKYPVLLHVRNTMLAVNQKDCEDIMVEVTSHE